MLWKFYNDIFSPHPLPNKHAVVDYDDVPFVTLMDVLAYSEVPYLFPGELFLLLMHLNVTSKFILF